MKVFGKYYCKTTFRCVLCLKWIFLLNIKSSLNVPSSFSKNRLYKANSTLLLKAALKKLYKVTDNKINWRFYFYQTQSNPKRAPVFSPPPSRSLTLWVSLSQPSLLLTTQFSRHLPQLRWRLCIGLLSSSLFFSSPPYSSLFPFFFLSIFKGF